MNNDEEVLSGESPDLVWPGQRYSEVAEDVAWAFIALLLREAQWVHRRVETIGILSRVDARRSVSVDFTVPEELREAIHVASSNQWLVPIALVHREKLRHFDLRQGSSAIPLLGHADTSEIAFWVLTLSAGLALERLESTEDSGGVPRIESGSLDDQLMYLLAELAGEDVENAAAAHAQFSLLSETTSEDFLLEANDSPEVWDRRCAQARAAMDYPVFAYLFSWFRENRLLVAQLDGAERRQIVKYGYDTPLEEGDDPAPDLEDAGEGLDAASPDQAADVVGDLEEVETSSLGLFSRARSAAREWLDSGFRRLMLEVDERLLVTQIFDVPVRSMARAECYHVEVAIPEELVVLSAAIYDHNDLKYYDWDSEVNRVSLRAVNVELGEKPRLAVAIRPDRHGFPSAALAIGFVTSFVLVVGACLSPLVTNTASVSVSVLLGMSALFTGMVVRAGEHRLVQASFYRARRLLFGIAMCALVATVTLAFVKCGTIQEWVWIVCAALASILTFPLLGFWYLANSSRPT